jgi:2-keto-4-pentenoate hydratase/2-oxohepta-3-ene-1,7-dioic acid hydratase in catechol pathway
VRLGTLRTDAGLRTVVLRDGQVAAVQGSVKELLGGGLDRIRSAVESAAPVEAYDPSRLGPAVPDPGKVLCIGKNYADHVQELGGSESPAKPEVFMRARTSLAGPYQSVPRPRVSQRMDWEVELAVVIGKPGRYIPAGRASEHIGGYCVFNDISFRDFQNFGSQWTPGKNFDSSGPLGPFVVTPDEVDDPFDLDLTSVIRREDGEEETLQSSNTSLMVHRVPDLIAFLSQFTTLEPGDVIATGTPGGVGFGRQPPVWLQPGQTIICRIEDLGDLKNQVVEEPPPSP